MASMKPVVGIVGWQNSGKTTLVVELVKHLTGLNYKVSTVKHAHHAFDIDKPGKDSFKHRDAGAAEVMIASDTRWALMRELRDAAHPTLPELVAQMGPADVILAEGFKTGRHPKIEVWRNPETELLALSDPQIIAVVAPKDIVLPLCPCPTIARDDLQAVTSLILDTCHATAET